MFWIMLALWIVFNGKITLEILLIGIVICGILQWFAAKILDIRSKKNPLWRKIPLFIKYGVILIWEMIKSNLQVMKIILSPHLTNKPKLAKFTTSLKENSSKVLLANSITLTPGTITTRLQKGEYLIHGLDEKFTEDMEHSIFVKQLTEMEE